MADTSADSAAPPAAPSAATKDRSSTLDDEKDSKKKGNWLEKSVQRKLSIDALPALRRTAPFDPYLHPLGEDAPEIVPAFIEVSAGSRNKYEWDSEVGVMMLDRVLHSAVFYPNDYGFIPQTLCGDGDPLDILVMCTSPLIPGCLVHARPICYMVMEDEKGLDEKVLAVLANDPMYSSIKTMDDIPEHKLREIDHFFSSYKQLEKNKWVKTEGWRGTEDTLELIRSTHQKFIEKEQQLEEEL